MTRRNDRAECPELSGEALERHLFGCESCRIDARISAAWKALSAPDAEGPAPVRDAFLSRVLTARRSGLRRDRRRRYLLAAAAVLLFFFFAGSGQRSGVTSDPEIRAVDAFATLTATSSVEEMLPE